MNTGFFLTICPETACVAQEPEARDAAGPGPDAAAARIPAGTGLPGTGPEH